MPELPEVEAAARHLDRLARGRQIASAELLRPRLAPHSAPEEFASRLCDASINRVHRRGKHILFDLDNSDTLLVHLRMSGRFSFLNDEDENPKFAHAIFHFADGGRLVFDDQRHFGLMKIVSTAELFEAPELAKLAPEPFSDEFNELYLRTQLKRSKRSLKEFLLDQTKVCGLGNIYASEALFLARTNPRKLSNKVTAPAAVRLYESIRAVLAKAIEHTGSQLLNARNIDGAYFSGQADAGWGVYDREGADCLACDSTIVRIKQGGRSTYYCRKCQRS
jgi:formamidopyrimidine-DNA glycosylase